MFSWINKEWNDSTWQQVIILIVGVIYSILISYFFVYNLGHGGNFMKIMVINGSPRKSGNTGILLDHAIKGAVSQGAETELIHLYKLSYKGCESCFSCKLKGGKSYGRCAMNDELTPILHKFETADALLLGSPIYLGGVTGEMKSFLERLVFPYLVYDKERSSLYTKKIPIGFIYTLGAPESRIKEMGYDQNFKLMEMIMARYFGGPLESLMVTDTCQFDDYLKYVATAFDAEAKAKRRKDVFPIDCQNAYAMGVKLVG
jgi:multimeric flavodoxin WrbA